MEKPPLRSRRNGLLDLSIEKVPKIMQNKLQISKIEEMPNLPNLQKSVSENKSKKLPYKNKIRVPSTPDEKVYLRKALDFLSNIETGQEPIQQKNLNQEKVKLYFQRKSYRKFLFDTVMENYKNIDLSEAPMHMPASQMTDALNYEFQTQYPQLDSGLTLSKIVNLQYTIIQTLCGELDIEI